MYALAAKRSMVLFAAFLCGGCESIGYYAHLTGGQLDLLMKREPVDKVVDGLKDEQDETLRTRLLASQNVLDFAENDLGLEVGGRYRSYVDVGREAVVWNVFAAPELSLEAHTWCYPFVGCAPYRGYFDREKALGYARRLESELLETHLGSVSAYSTLGWFDDPLLSTFIDMPELDFVELLFHELAHSRIWVKGDATFNESFASFVGREGLRDWLSAQGRQDEFAVYLSGQRGWRAARALLDQTRDELEAVYAGDLDDDGKLEAKQTILEATAACLEAHSTATGVAGYRRLIPLLNNAYLASLATYSDKVPAFAAIFAEEDGDWNRFYARVEALAALDDDARQRILVRSGQEQVAADGDDDGANEIQCESLPGHGLDGEPSGAEHDDVRSGRHG